MTFAKLRSRLIALAALLALAFPAAGARAETLSDLVEKWLASPHGDYGSLSFTYWNKDGAVPENCAACHSEPGFIDWLGADGSSFGVVDHPAAINSPIGCASCHTSAAHALDSVPFPSGVSVAGLGSDAVCSVCHQGRQSGDAVSAASSGHDPDAVVPELGFLNVHYGIAAAIMHGADVRGGFHYEGRRYAGRFAHVPSASTCNACHDAHTTAVETEGCLSCHRGVEDIRAIRTRHVDYDGDGDISVGVHAEIEGLKSKLYGAIQRYGAEVAGVPIGYAPGRFPYFFTDLDGDGQIGEAEAIFPNRYSSWTPRLLQAAYNYQVAVKDKGAWVHNPAYAIQLLHDSIQSLSERVEVDTGGLVRP